MPKPLKKRATSRPKSDPNEAAFDLVRRSTEAHESPAPATDFKAELKAYMSKIGARGGRASGAKRMEMPVEERRRIASLAARAMWAKKKAAKKR
jgi:hypothetical protein